MSLFRFLKPGRESGKDVAVVGSGLVARTVALELARRGGSVTVVESQTDGAKVGPGLIAAGTGHPFDRVVDTLGRTDALAIWDAGRESRTLLVEFLDDVGRDCSLEAKGSFLLAGTREEAEALAESEDALRDEGFPGEFLDHYMLETHFDVSGFAGAYWAADDMAVDPADLLATVHAAALAAGVTFRPDRALSVGGDDDRAAVETADASVPASAVVVATDDLPGHLLSRMAPSLLPPRHARLHAEVQAGASLPSAARTADGRIAWQVLGSRVSLAATGGPRSTPEDPGPLAAMAPRLHVQAGSEAPAHGPGGRTTDLLPIVGALGPGPFHAACGLGPLEAGLAFVVARWIAETVLTGRDPTPRPFRSDRPAVSHPV